MTTTAVKDAGSLLSIPVQSFAAQKTSGVGDASFQNVLSGHAEQKFETKQSNETAKPKKTQDSDQFRVNEKKVSPKAEQLNQQTKDAEEVEESREPEQEEAMKVLATAAAEIIQTITEVFEIPKEDVEGILDEMGLSEISLLDQAVLGEVLLKAGGDKDQAALLTDGELYQKFNEVMDELTQVLDSESGWENLNIREFRLNFEPKLAAQEDVPAGTKEILPDMAQEILPKEEQDTDAGTVLKQDSGDLKISAQDLRRETKAADTPEHTNPLDRTRARQTEPVEITEEKASPQVKIAADNPDNRENLATDEGGSLGMKAMVESADETGSKEEGAQEQDTSRRRDRQLPESPAFAQKVNEAVQTRTGDVAVSQTTESFSPQTQDIMRQIMDYMRVQVKPEMTNLEMQLHPASLGTIHIHLQSRGGVVTANLVAQNETVKNALESQMVQLKESFAEQGIKVEAVEVTVQTHQFEQNLEQNNREQTGQDGGAAKNRRSRRINLNEDFSTLDEELDEADRIAAELMEANGNTIDYTA